MIRALDIPGGYGARTTPFKQPNFIKPLESLQLMQGQQQLGQARKQEDFRDMARGTLSDRLSQPIEPSELDRIEIAGVVDKFIQTKGIDPNMRETLINDFTKRRMQPRQESRQNEMLMSQLSPEAYLAQQAKTPKIPAQQQPEAIRFKIQSAINALNGRIAQDTAKGIDTSSSQKLLESFKKEQSKDSPSLRQAYMDANLDPDAVDPLSPPPDESPSFYDESGKFKTLSDREVGILQSSFPAKFQEYEAQEKRMEREEEQASSRGFKSRAEGRTTKKDKILEDEKYLKAWNAMKKLNANPQDITKKRMALNVQLRDETGAAIGANEFNDMMSFVLPKEDYRRLIGETTGLGVVLRGLVNDDLKESHMKKISEKYLDKVNSDKLSEYIDDAISNQYYMRSEEPAKSKESPKSESDPLGLGI